jgi:DNA-binding MarR family transcriptional regulator
MEQAQLLSRNLRRVKQLYNRILLRELAIHNLDQHFEALMALSEQDKPVTQNMLAELLQMDKSRIVSIVYDLGKRHLIIIKTNPADRREHFINLSVKGKAAIPVIENTINKVNEFANTGISEADLDIFFGVSSAMHQNLAKYAEQEAFALNAKAS